ncbi:MULTISPECIES: DUF6491 family protein [Phenylobacterium]|uniref:NusG domain-containing protein n=1 Tax=Phenylobacterium koreense TaxID=266125 RepID=A0ABV2EGX3_9CAUL
MQRLLLAAAFAALASGPALAADQATAPAQANQCFRVSQIHNHTKADDRTLYLSVRNGKEVFRLDMAGACLAGVSSSGPLVLTPTAGTDLVCRPLDLDLKVRMAPGALTPCIIRSITRLTPEQVATLPPKVRP